MAAATGNTVTLQSNSYQGRYMKLTCTSTQDVSNNKTNISWKLESIGGSSSYYATICRVYIAGTEVYSIDKGYTYHSFPVAKGETTGSLSVTMGSDGNKLIYVDMDVAIYTSSTTRYSVQDGWQLPTVPRYPTISSFSVAKVSGSSTSVSVTWAGSAPGGSISKVEYSKDNGSTFTNANTTSSPFTISGLTSNTGYNFKIRVTSSASGLTATSSAYYQSTYQQPTANISTENISGYNGLSQIKVNWSSNMTISKVEFSKDNGASFPVTQNINTTSGNYTFTGLTEGQSYNFKVRVTAATGSCVTTSGTSSRTAYKRVSGNLYVNGTKVATNNGQTGVALKNGDTLQIKDITNTGSLNYKLFFENPDNQHQYTSAVQTGTTAVSMDVNQIASRLQYFPNDPSQGFNVGIVTLNDSSQHALYHEFFGTISAVNVNPTFTDDRWTYQDTNATTVALTGSNQILVNGFSKLRVSVNTAASGNGYATISQYTVSGCTSGSSTTTGNIDCANATNGGTITVTARDSRSKTTSTTKTATFKNYVVPTMTSISTTRSNGGVGTVTTLSFNGTWWNANFGASNNTLSASYRYKSGSTWSSSRAITLTTSGNDYSFNDTIYGDLDANGFTLGTTFDIEVTITDALNGGKQWTTTLTSGTPAIAISGSNVAIGGQYQSNPGGKLQVQGDITSTGVTISKMNNRPFAIAGSDTASTSGWYKICSSTMSGYGNTNIIWVVSNNYATEQKGILNLEMRSNNGSIQCWALKWLVRSGFGSDYAKLTISGNTWTLYFYKSNSQYGRVTFHEIMHNGIGDKDGYTVTYYSSNTPESTAPTANTTSSDGGRVNVANSADSATTAGKLSKALGSGTIAQTTIMDISGSTDGLMLTYEAGTSDVGVSKLYTTDDANARIELGNNVSGTYKRAAYVENGKFKIDGFTRNTTDTWIPVLNGGALDYAPRQIWSSKTHTNYNNNQDNLATMSVLSYWNGAYNSSNSSNLTYAHQGTIQCKPTSLYDNSSGSTGTITLSQTAANFTYLTIFYRESKNQQSYGSVWLYSPNGKYARQQIIEKSGTDMRFNTTRGVISGTSITRDYGAVDYLSGAKYDVQEMWIVKVIGWK